MKSFVALTFLLSATVAFGATINLNKEVQPLTIFSYLTSNSSVPKTKETVVADDPISPTYFSVVTPQNSFAFGRMIAEVAQTTIDVLSKMDLTEQGLKSLLQLIMPLISIYLGPYTQVILPMLSGISSVLFKSLPANML